MKKLKPLFLFLGFSLAGTGMASAQAETAQATGKTDLDLKGQRAKIDSLDAQLLKILGEREKIVREIGVYKSRNNVPALQAARFQQVLNQSIATGKQLGLSAEFITELMNAIHKESLRIEEEIKQKKE